MISIIKIDLDEMKNSQNLGSRHLLPRMILHIDAGYKTRGESK